ncbi:MAG TPA: DUF4403 family protein [Longimicrobiales bacterium]|nr:DUF4403 family protein [Longimicrobiales bacterium]
MVPALRHVPPWVKIAVAAGLVLGALLVVLQWRGQDFLEAPAPEIQADAELLEPAIASSLAVPLGIPLARLVALLEDAVPREFGSMDERRELPGQDRTSLAFSLERSPIRASVEGRVARVETVLEYALRAYYDPPVLPEVSGSCGTGDDGKRRLRVVIEAPLRLTEDWRLATTAELVTVEPPTDEDRDRCRVTFLGFDLTDRVVDGARTYLEQQERTVDSIARSLDLRPSFEAWWKTLREPVELADSVWLVVGPNGVRQGSLQGVGDSVWVELALDAMPSVVVGPRPVVDETPLPPLGTGTFEPGLDLIVEGRAEWGTVSGMLMDELAGTEVRHEGRTVTVDSLRVFGIGGGRIALDVRVSGDLAARLFFTGTPALDSSGQVIALPDLDFDVATADVLVAAAAWMQRQGLRTLLRERARWPAAPVAAWLERWLDEGLNRSISDNLRVAGQVAWVTPREVHALRDHLLVRIAARADARMYVTGP